MTEDAILLYSYLLKTDAQAIMYDVKLGADICDDCQGLLPLGLSRQSGYQLYPEDQ